MAGPKLSATITIGGAIASSFRTAVGGVEGQLKKLGTTVRSLKTAQANLAAGKGLFDTAKLDEAQGRLTKLDALIARTQKRLDKDPGNVGLQARLAGLRDKADGARAEITKLEKAHAAAEAEVRKATGSTKLEADTLEKLRKAAQSAEQRIAALNRTRAAGAKVGESFRNAASEVGKAAAIIGGAGAVIGGAMFGVAKSFSDAGDEIANTASSLGVSTKALQELRYVAMHNNVATEEMDAALTKLSATMAKAGDDGGELQKTFDEMGLDLDAVELRALGPEKAFLRLSDAMKDLRNPADRVQLALALFGRTGARMVNTMSGGAAAVKELADEAGRLGYVMGDEAVARAGDMDKELKRLGATFTGIKNTIGAELAPAFVDLFGALKEFMVANGPAIRHWAIEFGAKFKEMVPAIISAAGQIFEGLTKVVSVVNTVVQATGGWGVALGAVATLISAKAIVAVVQLGVSLWQLGAAGFALASTVFPAVLVGLKAIALFMLTNPIGLAITGIALAAGLVITYWEPIKGFFAGLFDWISEKFSTAINFWVGGFQKFGEWIAGWWEGTIGGIKAAWDTVTGWFSDDDEEGQAKSMPSVRPGAAIAGAALAGAAVAAPLPAVDSPAAAALPPAATAPAMAGGGATVNQSNAITINAAPGQDPAAIAAQVDRILRDRQRQATNGALHD